MGERITIQVQGGELPARLWLPVGGQGPGVVLVHEIFGLSAYIERRARQLAERGYVVLAPELYWRQGPEALEPIEGPDPLAAGVARSTAADWDLAVADVAAAVRALKGRDELTGQVGLLGFCFGGGLAFATAAAFEAPGGQGGSVDALVSYYGSALPRLVDDHTVRVPSLHHFGLADDFIPAGTVSHIRDVVTRQPLTRFLTYEGANHAFDNDDAPWYHRDASAKAWAWTLDFLAEHVLTYV